MSKRRVFGLSFVLLLTSTASAFALPNSVVGNGRCDCMCDTANTSNYNEYDSVGYGCGALEGKTCNSENPQTGLIETGRLFGCAPTRENMQSTAPLNGLLDQGGGGQVFTRPGVVAPLDGVFRQ